MPPRKQVDRSDAGATSSMADVTGQPTRRGKYTRVMLPRKQVGRSDAGASSSIGDVTGQPTERGESAQVQKRGRRNFNRPRTLLRQQKRHLSQFVQDTGDHSDLGARRGGGPPNGEIPESVLRAIHRAGFYGATFISQYNVDHSVMRVLLERWRPETHTFHLPIGEATLTLQDVEVISGLPVEGDPITGTIIPPADMTWIGLVEEYLGFTPEVRDMEYSKIKTVAIRGHYFAEIERLGMVIQDQVVCDRLARCYIMMLLGALMSDTSGDRLSLGYLLHLRDLDASAGLSWGSAVLAHLYKQLCRASLKGVKEMTGALHILQIWIYSRIQCLRPVQVIQPPSFAVPKGLPQPPFGYLWCRGVFSHKNIPGYNVLLSRHMLDTMTENQMIWTPYEEQGVVIDPYYRRGVRTWMARVPMINYAYVEWHYPERVLRQFGKWQHCPVPLPDATNKLHRIGYKGNTNKNWATEHRDYIVLWTSRAPFPETTTFRVECEAPYMSWYRGETLLQVDPPRPVRAPDRYHPTSGWLPFIKNMWREWGNSCRSYKRLDKNVAASRTRVRVEARRHGIEFSSSSEDNVDDQEEDREGPSSTQDGRRHKQNRPLQRGRMFGQSRQPQPNVPRHSSVGDDTRERQTQIYPPQHSNVSEFVSGPSMSTQFMQTTQHSQVDPTFTSAFWSQFVAHLSHFAQLSIPPSYLPQMSYAHHSSLQRASAQEVRHEVDVQHENDMHGQDIFDFLDSPIPRKRRRTPSDYD